MKRYLTFITLAVCAFGSAQNINEVLQYGMENLQGTARFQAMGGAFGALGGDLSSLNVNPAGSAVFNNSLFTISGSNYNTNNQSSYFGNSISSRNNNLDLNQIGGAFVFKNTNSDSDWQKFTLALNYDVVTNFDNEYYVAGNSTQGIDNYFLNFAQGTPFGSILRQDGEYIEEAYLDIGSNQGYKEQQTFLGYYGGILDPISGDDNNTDYVSNAIYNSLNQELLRRTTGYNSKLTLNMGSQFKENIYMGASLNFHNVLYSRFDQFTENGYDPTSEIQRTTFDNYLQTEGYGFSFSLGAIGKLNENIRLGGSYQSPTWYQLEDDFSQRINSDLADDEINFIDLNIVNLFESYTVKTPSKMTGSIAIIFAQDGLLSFDYGFQDFSKAELRPTSDPSFQTVNNQISNDLGTVSTFRLGGEYKIEQVSLRAGYRFEQSPYTNGNTIGDLNAVSGGIGYNFGGSRLDFALSRSQQDINERLFDTGITTPAIINRINTNATVTYTINF